MEAIKDILNVNLARIIHSWLTSITASNVKKDLMGVINVALMATNVTNALNHSISKMESAMTVMTKDVVNAERTMIGASHARTAIICSSALV